MQAVIEERSWHGLEKLEQGLRRFLTRYCRDDNLVDDVIQETFVRAAHYRRNLTEDARLRPWVNRIARNVLADIRRRGRRYVFTPQGDPAWDVLDEFMRQDPIPSYRLGRWTVNQDEAMEHLAGALDEMRSTDRALLTSHYAGGGACRETSLACGVPVHLVKVRLFRARRRLVRAIERRLAEEHGIGPVAQAVTVAEAVA